MKGIDTLRQSVLEANLALVNAGLVFSTFGNVSGMDRESGLVAIKPSGVDYDRLCLEDTVVTDLDGRIVAGRLRPSSDLETHLTLYRAWDGIGGVVHTHSRHATAFAQACRAIPPLGTTHADYFRGEIPVTRMLTAAEIEGAYVTETGRVIVESFGSRDPLEIPAALVACHGPFTWGRTPQEAVHHASVLEEVARNARNTWALNPDAAEMPLALLERHWLRKHDANPGYGQTAQ